MNEHKGDLRGNKHYLSSTEKKKSLRKEIEACMEFDPRFMGVKGLRYEYESDLGSTKHHLSSAENKAFS